jgi:hypothetical protein
MFNFLRVSLIFAIDLTYAAVDGYKPKLVTTDCNYRDVRYGAATYDEKAVTEAGVDIVVYELSLCLNHLKAMKVDGVLLKKWLGVAEIEQKEVSTGRASKNCK